MVQLYLVKVQLLTTKLNMVTLRPICHLTGLSNRQSDKG